MKTFEAKWGLALILISAFATVLCLAVAAFAAMRIVGHGDRGLIWVCVLPLAVVVGCALFTVRGYILTPGAIYIQRLLWATRLPTDGLQSVSFEPHAMRWSIRTFGNGGLFAFTGKFWNRRLGSFRAFVTDLNRTVVLRFPHRTVVLSPSVPEEFVYEIVSAPA